jgi:Lipocalin-like domain
MKAVSCGALAALVAVSGLALAQSPTKPAGDHEKLIGAWHLAHIDAPGPDGKPAPIPQPTGMLIYTRDGHMSVQLMYPKSANAQSNEYVQDGYEASFGSYDVDEATHTLTHHVVGSVTRDLLRSARPADHWSVTWVHY